MPPPSCSKATCSGQIWSSGRAHQVVLEQTFRAQYEVQVLLGGFLHLEILHKENQTWKRCQGRAKLGEDHPDTLYTVHNLGTLLHDEKELSEAPKPWHLASEPACFECLAKGSVTLYKWRSGGRVRLMLIATAAVRFRASIQTCLWGKQLKGRFSRDDVANPLE